MDNEWEFSTKSNLVQFQELFVKATVYAFNEDNDNNNPSHISPLSSVLSSLSSNSSQSSYNNDDTIAVLKNLPCQLFFIEKLEGTLEDLLDVIEKTNHEVLLSCIFQVTFALAYLQKHYKSDEVKFEFFDLKYCHVGPIDFLQIETWLKMHCKI